MRDGTHIRRALIASAVAAVGLVLGRVPTASGSPSPHAPVRNPAAARTSSAPRVIFAGRGYRVVRPVVEVSASRPAPSHDAGPRANHGDTDDARAARHSRTSDRVAVEPAGKDRKSLRRLPDTAVAFFPTAHGRARNATPSRSPERGGRGSVLEAVFHDAHAPPLRS